MPQLPTSTAEEYGAEDEIKQYNQEEDDCSDSSTVDVVNDIKDDLLNEDNDNGKSHDDGLYRNHHTSRYMKGEGSHGGVYGSPASVIVGSHRYYEQSYRTPVTNHSSVSAHGGGANYSSGTQIRMPMYIRDERSYYEQNAWPPSPVAMPSHPSYPVHGYGGNMAQKYGGYRYPPGIPPGVPYYMPSGGYPGMPGRPPKEPKRPHVKKPLNAFMLYMKEQRPKIAAEFTLKESAAINQILGKRWHALDKSEQAKYYEMARKERAIHMQLYPGWSARDNYAQIGRKKKRPRDKNEEMNPKKCRARYGLDRQEQWCKPCRRKKKCIRFLVGADGETREVTPEVADQLEHSDSDENSAATTQIKKENQLPSQINMNIDNQQQQQQQAEVKAEQLLKSISNETRNDSKLSLLNNNSINNDEACHKKQPMTSSYSTEQKNSMSTLMMGHSAEANRTSCSNTVSHFPTNSSSNNFQDNSHSANYHTTTPHENKEHGHILGNENPKSPNMHCNTSSSLQPLEGGGIKSIRASCA